MDTEKRKALEERRRQLQLKQQVAEFAASDLQPYLEIVDYLSKRNVPYRMVHVAHIQANWLPYMRETMQQVPYLDYGFPMDRLCTDERMALFEELFQRYPSINSFRYVPDLPMVEKYHLPTDAREGPRKAAAFLDIPLDQQVYLSYLRYAPIVEIPLADLGWLIAHTLEEEWYAGRRDIGSHAIQFNWHASDKASENDHG